jgi:DNA repair protein RecN (Recombination protein N)
LNLSIYNFALIEEIQVGFDAGLNIITGETGAGKSIIINALNMLLGGRASTDYIRSGQQRAIIEASFNIKDNEQAKNKLDDLGVSYDQEDGLVISREITHNGNNRSRLNGRIVTLEMTREVRQYLIEIHGQHEHQLLFQPKEQLDLLDEFVGKSAKRLKNKLRDIYKTLKEKHENFNNLNQNEKERNRRLDLLKFQIDEIQEADLSKGEFEELLNTKKRLSNAEDLIKKVSQVYNQLYESDFQQVSIIDQLNQFLKDLDSLSEIDSKLEVVTESLRDVTYELQDIVYELDDYQENIEFSPQRLDEVERRIQLINKLKRKYGDSIEEIFSYKTKIKAELEELQSSDLRLGELEKEIRQLKKEYLERANKLSDLRQEVANDFEEKVILELQDLSMEKSKFEVSFNSQINNSKEELSLNGITPYGIDQVQFLISPNPGEELKAIAKIASGGELSRTMLALKKIIAEVDQVQTLIFDEVDAGIGGRAANLVANKLAVIAQNRQVISITHLPQIASMADSHYYISKDIETDHAQTKLIQLDEDERIKELSRMLSGSSLTDTTREHALEMIKLAEKKKESICKAKVE